jgi:hypothetical protein
VPDFPFFFTGFPETRFQIMPPVSVISALGGGYAVRVPVQGGSAGDPLVSLSSENENRIIIARLSVKYVSIIRRRCLP